MTITIKTCIRCGHEWPTKAAKPVVCPRCKTAYWDVPRKVRKVKEG